MAENPSCPDCGAEIPSGAPMGLCEACRLKAATGKDEPESSGDKNSEKSTIAFSLPPIEKASERPGDRIGRYKLLQEIGEGGMGTVWMAEQEEPVRRRVALKVIKLGMDTKQVIARFEAERQALALMDHPNIAKVFDAGTTDTGRPFFVMELVRGIRITDYCDQNNLTTKQRLDLFIKVCQAIQHAHQKGIIHRDIKPSNILVAMQDGAPVPKVIDFGIAKATEQRLTDKTVYTALGQIVGTPAYMSPEQAEMTTLDIDTRSDIYSLGVLLYELLTGKTPFDPHELVEAGVEAMLRTIREQEPQRPSTRLTTMEEGELTATAKRHQTDPPKLVRLVRGDLDWIVMKCLEKDRGRRYETANGLARDIERHLSNEPVVARPPSSLYRFRKLVRRNKLAVAATGAVAISLVVGLGLFGWEFVGKSKALNRVLLAEKAARAEAQRADLNAVQEAAERERAEAAKDEARKTLAASDFLQAARLIGEDKGSEALPYLARSLSADPTNAGVATRLGTLLSQHSWMVPVFTLKHGDWVVTAQFNPEGTRILTAAADGTARVWDARNGQPASPPLEHPGPVTSAQFSADGKRILTASRGGARVWDTQSGQPVTGFMGDQGGVQTATFSPDGKKIVTTLWAGIAGREGARVWDAESGRAITGPLGSGGGIVSAQFHAAGTRILSVSTDGRAQVWDAQSGQLLSELSKNAQRTIRARFSPNGRLIATVSADGTAQVWDSESSQALGEPIKYSRPAPWVWFSRDGRHIVACSADKVLGIAEAQSGQPWSGSLEACGGVDSAQFSPEGKQFVVISGSIAQVYNTENGQALTEALRHAGPISSAIFSPDGKRILTGSWDNTARIWEVQSTSAVARILKHSDSVSSARFSPDGKRIVTACKDGTARVWDAQTGQPLTEPIRHEREVLSAQFSQDGRRILTALDCRTARVWDAETGQPLTRLRPDDGSWESNGFAVQFSPDGRRAVTVPISGAARIWDLQTGQVLAELRRDASSARFSPDGTRLVTTGSIDNTARIWDAKTGQQLGDDLKHSAAVMDAEFSADGKRVVTASLDRTARIWDTRPGQALSAPLRHSGQVRWAHFCPDGTLIVTVETGTVARLWNARTGQAATEPLRHSAIINSAEFSPDGQRLVTGSDDSTARVWDTRTGQPLCEPLQHLGRVVSVQFSPDGKRVLTASEDNLARVWDLLAPTSGRCDWLPQLAEAFSGQALNREGIMESLKQEPADALRQLRLKLNAAPQADDWARWGRWLLAEPLTRSISPFSEPRPPQFVEAGMEEKTPDSLAQADRATPGNRELPARLSGPHNASGLASGKPSQQPTRLIPQRSAQTPPELIDLTRYYNVGLTENLHMPEPGGNNLATLPVGVQSLAGVSFDIRGVVQLDSPQLFRMQLAGLVYPRLISGIEIARRCRRLHFLHAAGFGESEGRPIGAYVVHYADGHQREVPIIYGRDVRDWAVMAAEARGRLREAESQTAPAEPQSRPAGPIVAWTGRNRLGVNVQLFKSTWENPDPGLEIKTLDYVSKMARAAPFLIAITAEPVTGEQKADVHE